MAWRSEGSPCASAEPRQGRPLLVGNEGEDRGARERDERAGVIEPRARRVGKGRVFAEFICKINRLTKRHGKRLMIWADILKHHADAIGPIPKDVIFLNWWYNAESKEWMIDHSRHIRKAGHELVVCPGVNNWGAFMPRLARMRDNAISGLATAPPYIPDCIASAITRAEARIRPTDTAPSSISCESEARIAAVSRKMQTDLR